MTEADQSSTPVTPLDASTVLLIRDSDDGIEVFMVVRHSKADFAGGAAQGHPCAIDERKGCSYGAQRPLGPWRCEPKGSFQT